MTETERHCYENYGKNVQRQAILRRMSDLVDKSVRAEYSARNSLTRFRKQVKLMRHKLGISQQTMAKLVGISQSRYSQIESGTKKRDDISMITARKIAAIFDATVTISMVSYLELVHGVANENVVPIPSFGLQYSRCEYELQSVDMYVKFGKEQKILRDGAIDDKVGIMEGLRKRERNIPPGSKEFGNLYVNSLNIMLDQEEIPNEKEIEET
jgi:DNA-binding XRE family transcriptional regulator